MYCKAIYFPYINVPKGRWLTRMLLYWDQIGTIVPMDYVHNKELWDSYSLDLIEDQQLQLVSPMDYTYKIPNFRGAFLELVDKDPKLKKRIKLNVNNTTKIHIEKMDGLGEDLKDRGLASTKNYPWYNVESHTADLFMSYLASVIGLLDEIQMEPITDSKRWFSIYHQDLTSRQNEDLRSYRDGIFENILPVPLEMIPPEELLDFKNKYRKQLIPFRMEVEFAIVDILSARTPELQQKMRLNYVRKFKEQADEIQARMRERHWPPYVMTSLLAYTPMANAIAQQDGHQMLLAVPPLVSAFIGAYLGLNQKRQQILSSPTAYAVLVQRTFNNPNTVQRL